ncbi:recombinase family protein [Mesorhizobium sp. M7A.F.Ca.ET.027.02.1.1]|uniref:recombinase family protein n=1 Tax=Mesorhizobium sp. M7A.F.Ca.ET.027.02.1.1 TaxID=2496655 RepID=UPI001FDF37F2|nr:recombinase family protein [Mesorhizobium sp. M7A.F.Ca.ET.027.02.1.1]
MRTPHPAAKTIALVWRACLEALRAGDILVVWKLDRRARDLRYLVNVVADLMKRNLGLKVLAGEGAPAAPPLPNGRLAFAILTGDVCAEVGITRQTLSTGLSGQK